MKSTVEGSLADKIDEEEKDQVKEAMEDGQEWLQSNPEADAEEIKEKQMILLGIPSFPCGSNVRSHGDPSGIVEFFSMS